MTTTGSGLEPDDRWDDIYLADRWPRIVELVTQARAETDGADAALRRLYQLVRAEPTEVLVGMAMDAARSALRRAVRAEALAAEREAEREAERARAAERRAEREAEEERRRAEASERSSAAQRRWREERAAMTAEEWARTKAERHAAKEAERAERRRIREEAKADRERKRQEEAALDEYYRSGQAVRDAFDKLVDGIREEAFIEWTAELLGSEIALGDGTHTTWGEATVEQHQARIAMHRRNALAGTEGVVRHLQAVEDIQNAGVACLNELPSRELDAA